jgi:hypothetical protein
MMKILMTFPYFVRFALLCFALGLVAGVALAVRTI